MRGGRRKVTATLRLMLWALLPGKSAGSAPRCKLEHTAAGNSVWQCRPEELRGGVERFLDDRGELRLIFLDCLGIAAPFVLFRLKRQGFSRCVVRVTGQGLYVEARR